MITSVHSTRPNANLERGIRPVNIRTDLAPIADLIEIAFSDRMDRGGRSALREMRMMSKLGIGAGIVFRMSDLTMGIQLGYVWVEDQKIVGNVSIYPTKDYTKQKVWVVANVATHPDYRRRGIARKLMHHSMEQITRNGGDRAVLQVDYDNYGAQKIYRDLGFVDERAWTVWTRQGSRHVPSPAEFDNVFISRRRWREWNAEFELAKQVRPNEKGGLGWLRPTEKSQFQNTLLNWADNLIKFRNKEHLIIRSKDENAILASLIIDRTFGTATRLILIVHPDYVGLYDEALISTAVRRFGNEKLVIEHPHDQSFTNEIFRRYQFTSHRTAIHMHWNAH